MQPQTGERVAHFSLQARLATGGMGVVYRAFDERTKRPVALKVLSTQFGADPDYRDRFAQEAELAARVEHPNIVPIYDVGAFPTLYIAMRLIPGTDLATELRNGPLPNARVLDIADSVAAALDEAHRHALVHRDVKPGNVLLAPTRDRHRREHVYLTDFGIARSTVDEQRLARPVVVLGSPAYMAPERLAGEPGGPACDVYGLACVLFECFTGVRPWPQQAPPEEINRRQVVDPPRLASYRRDLPPPLDEVLFAAMHRDVRRRPATAGDLAAAARAAFAAPPARSPSSAGGPGAPQQRPAPPRSAPPPAPPPAPPSAAPSPPSFASFPPPVGPPGTPTSHRTTRRTTQRATRPRRSRRLLLAVLSLVVVLGAALLVLGLTGRLSSAEDPADRALQARLPAAVFGSCSPVEQAAGETAALRCAGTDPRVERLEVRQVPDAAALGTRFAALSADRGLVTRRCQDEAGNSGGFWTRGGTRQGAFACFTDAAGARRVLWQYDADGVEVQAVGGQSGADGAAALYTWWSDEARDRPLAG